MSAALTGVVGKRSAIAVNDRRIAVKKGKVWLATVPRRECNDVGLLACACRAVGVYRRLRGRGGSADTAAASCLGQVAVGRWLAELVAPRRLAALLHRDLDRERVQEQRVDIGRRPVVREPAATEDDAADSPRRPRPLGSAVTPDSGSGCAPSRGPPGTCARFRPAPRSELHSGNPREPALPVVPLLPISAR